MARQKEIDNLYYFSNNEFNSKKNEAKKEKERAKRIKEKKEQEKSQFELDTETVIGMTNKNRKNQKLNSQKKLTKKQAQILRKKKILKKILKTITLLFLIVGGFVFALVSPIFNINEIQVINNNQLSTDTIISLSQIRIGQNIFKFRTNKIKKEIKTNAYVEEVSIKRRLPSKIEITVKERERKYNVEFLNEYAYINSQGYILEISEEKLDLPVIKGISTNEEDIKPGNRLNDQDLLKLETVIQIMNVCKDYEIDNMVSSINIENKNNYTIYMEEEKKTIYLGDASNLSIKILYAAPILENTKGLEGEIFVDGDVNNNFKPRFKENIIM